MSQRSLGGSIRGLITSLVILAQLLALPVWAQENCGFQDLTANRTGPKEVTPITDHVSQTAIDGQRVADQRNIKDGKTRDKERDDYHLEVEPPVPRWRRIMARAGLAVSSLLGLELVTKFMENPNPVTLAAAAGAAFAGFVGADYVTERLHFKSDNVWYKSPFKFLRDIARHGRVHHEVPLGVLAKSYIERLGIDAHWAVPLMGATAGLAHSGVVGKAVDGLLANFGVGPGVGQAVDVTLGALIGAFGFAAWHGSYSHQQAHNPKPNWFVKTLQRLHILMPPEVHARHHKPPFQDNYAWFGFLDMFRGRDYWAKQVRAYYERTGTMPGTWIQDPRSIPKDIVEKLKAEYKDKVDTIPMDLWAYAPKAYPNRVPAELKEPLAYVQERWRVDFIKARRLEYQDSAPTDPKAEEKWLAEQKEFEWIYGPVPHPLYPEGPKPQPENPS